MQESHDNSTLLADVCRALEVAGVTPAEVKPGEVRRDGKRRITLVYDCRPAKQPRPRVYVSPFGTSFGGGS